MTTKTDAGPTLSDDELALIREEAAAITDDWAERQLIDPSRKESDAKFVREILRLCAPEPELQAVPVTPSSQWRANGEPDPHGKHYDCERAALTLGTLTDDELANEAFLNYDTRLSLEDLLHPKPGRHMPIVWMTAVKERIRWLSRALERALAPASEVQAEKDAKTAELHKMLANIMHDQTTAMQSALIEWKHGNGAEAGLQWIVNTLMGPGLLPDFDAEHGTNAQFWFDANQSQPMPKCFCGNPSHIGWMGQGFCSNAHYDEAKAKHDTAPASSAGDE